VLITPLAPVGEDQAKIIELRNFAQRAVSFCFVAILPVLLFFSAAPAAHAHAATVVFLVSPPAVIRHILHHRTGIIATTRSNASGLVVNIKTARSLGLNLSQSILVRANELVE
jgi:hypothetical protein